MTAESHERATERTSEAMGKIEKELGNSADIVVMIQGDEPMVSPEMIDEALVPLSKDPSIQVVNLMAEIASIEDFEDPNEVKVVCNLKGEALYFSREPIPSLKKGAEKIPMRKQVCIIPFRRDYLIRFNQISPTPLEIAESVDMMRILEHGDKVRMVFTDCQTCSVDTSEDLELVENLMRADPLVGKYSTEVS